MLVKRQQSSVHKDPQKTAVGVAYSAKALCVRHVKHPTL